MNEQITGALFKRMVLHGAAVITAQKQAINDLNVFPVPDGDTGTNMSMTIGTAVTELRKSEPATVEQAASVTASALLRGARGNSGVILSLLFRGLSKALKGRETADAAAFAAAMQEGVSAAYKAVMKPAEGTVLTVSRLAAKQAVDTAAAGETDLERVLEDAIRVGYAALAQTTEMNPVLKKAGVVDAGGAGFLLAIDSDADRLAMGIAAHLDDEAELAEIERVFNAIVDRDLVEEYRAVSELVEALPADARAEDIESAVAACLGLLEGVLDCFDPANWLRDDKDYELLLESTSRVGFNDAQLAVSDAVFERFGAMLAQGEPYGNDTSM